MGKKLLNLSTRFDFLYKHSLNHVSCQEELAELLSQMYIGLHMSTRYSCSIVMKHEFFQQIFEKSSYIKFHESRPVGAELYHEDGQT